MKKKLIKKLEEIKDELLVKSYTNESNIGLMNGLSGEILFFLNYSKYKKDNVILNHSYALIEKLMSNLSVTNYTFASGYSGVGWLLEYLHKNNYADINSNDLLEEVDKYIFNKLNQDIKRGNYDYLHGAIGGGLYFLNRSNCKIREDALSILASNLKKISIETENHIKWNFFNILEQKVEVGNYNFGVSHGIPSILYFLSKISKETNLSIDTESILNKGIDFLFSYLKDGEIFGSFFMNSNKSLHTSRLGWCYGDLGVCVSLIQISEEVKRPDVLKKIEVILDFNCGRLDINSNNIFDAGFCHGASGVAYLFKKAYDYFGKEKYLTTSNYWYDKTLEFASFENGLAGYKSYKPSLNISDNGKKVYINDRGLLEGVSGIGLSILGYLSGKNNLLWDNAFLIS